MYCLFMFILASVENYTHLRSCHHLMTRFQRIQHLHKKPKLPVPWKWLSSQSDCDGSDFKPDACASHDIETNGIGCTGTIQIVCDFSQKLLWTVCGLKKQASRSATAAFVGSAAAGKKLQLREENNPELVSKPPRSRRCRHVLREDLKLLPVT